MHKIRNNGTFWSVSFHINLSQLLLFSPTACIHVGMNLFLKIVRYMYAVDLYSNSFESDFMHLLLSDILVTMETSLMHVGTQCQSIIIL